MKILLKTVICFFPLVTLAAVPIADYRMDECSWNGTAEEVSDQSGNYNAKVDKANTATTVDEHILNRSGAFNQGSTDDSAIAIPPSVLDGRTDFTFTVWLYPTSDIQSKQTFLSAENGDNTDEDDLLFRIRYNNNHINLKYDGNGNNSNGDQIDFAQTADDIPANQWTFLALSKSGDTACVTVNETRDCQTVPEGMDPLSIKYLILAQDSAGGASQEYYSGSAFPGYMDEVKFYDTNLSEMELQKIYENERNTKNYDGSIRKEVVCFPGGDPVAEYRMDECYWTGSGTFDVEDMQKGNNAETYNSAQPDKNDAIVNFSGKFGPTGYFQAENTQSINSEWTLSLWMKFPLDGTDHEDFSGTNLGFTYYFATGSLSDTGDLPAFTLDGDDLQWAIYDEDGNFEKQDIDDTLNDPGSGWHMISFVKHSDDTTTLYIDGTETDTISRGSDGEIGVYLTSTDNKDGQALSVPVDEFKIWNNALTSADIAQIYQNESDAKNFNGTERSATVCDASISANSWELVGIPIDLRSDSKTVAETFQGITGTYGTDWRVYRRDYSDSNNSSWYTYLDDPDTNLTEFGKAYWLGSKKSETWHVNGTQAVNYDSAYNGSSDCVANECVEIDMQSIVLSEDDGDDLMGTGPYRYNMTGFVGKTPVKWADCRFIVDGDVYTPTAAENAGFASKQIWQYSPNGSNDYATCDDSMTECTLIPFKGFWIELHGAAKNKTVKLLIPKE